MQENSNTPLDGLQEDQLRRNLDAVLARFGRAAERAGRSAGEVQLVAVSKWHPLPAILAVARHWRSFAGGPCPRPIFGENYMQEVMAKQDEAALLGEGALTWHFTGHLQSKKAKQTLGRFELVHTLDSLTLAQNLQKALQQGEIAVKKTDSALFQPVLVQVNVGLEESKSGIAPEELEEFLTTLQVFNGIQVQGLMILPPFSEDPEDTRPYFIRLRQMRDRLEKSLGIKLPHLSMGMSHDFEAAIEEGATLVRVGTDIFGQRQY